MSKAMTFSRRRRAGESGMDFLEDSLYLVPSETDMVNARKATRKNLAPVKAQIEFEAMFEDAPRSKRMKGQLNELSWQRKRKTDTDSLSSGTDDTSLRSQRLRGGANNPNERKVKNVVSSPSECKSKPPGFHHYTPSPHVNIIDIKLSQSKTKINRVPYFHCTQYDEPRKPKGKTTCGTQTLYRESSAQTLPYLPDVSNKENELETLEIFKLPKILPGDGPPGIYEVEVLERARKRWQFANALKEHFKKQLNEAKEQARLHKHKHILAAFEWEYWIEREEHIQECQMMRLELLIGMFDKRELEMHEASKRRIEHSCEQIEAKREAALHKNDIEFGRQMRRLEISHKKLPRNWRKENIVSQLGNPKSEFYAPQQRYGVNPSRRHFRGGRKAFEARINDLEKKVASTGKLVCPFAKLKEWSTPKHRFLEVEQNFCSDENLRKMYDSLMGLRQKSTKQKVKPKCLIEKAVPWAFIHREDTVIFTPPAPPSASELVSEETVDEQSEELERQRLEEFLRIVAEKKRRLKYLQDQYEQEEIEAMLTEYEGTTIGWLMRFLSEEMCRLQEQRILHFITMLAQKERWRREAAEAGLRQKENEMRQIYEQLYMETQGANTEVCKEYLSSILNVDIKDYADQTATTYVTKFAKTIDSDIQRWLNSLSDIQNPLNFDTLRYTLKDIIFPDVDKVLKRQEKESILSYIIEDVLFANIFKILEPYDIAFTIANETVDRLIDNDLYYFSPHCSSECFCTECKCPEAEKEAKAIVRKVIRYAVPGRRWRTETERIADENVNDILEDVFEALIAKGLMYESDSVCHFCELTRQRAFLNIFKPTSDAPTVSTESTEPCSDLSQPNLIIHQHKPARIIYTDQYENISHDPTDLSSELSFKEEECPVEFSGGERLPTSRSFLSTIIKDVISKFIPQESDDSALSDALSTETREQPCDTCDARGIIMKIVKEIYTKETTRGAEIESDGTGDPVYENYPHDLEEDDNFQLIMNESEIELIEKDICKHTDEPQRDEYVKQLVKEGKVRVIRKSKIQFDHDAESHDAPLEVFELVSETNLKENHDDPVQALENVSEANLEAAVIDLADQQTDDTTAPKDLEEPSLSRRSSKMSKGHIVFQDVVDQDSQRSGTGVEMSDTTEQAEEVEEEN